MNRGKNIERKYSLFALAAHELAHWVLCKEQSIETYDGFYTEMVDNDNICQGLTIFDDKTPDDKCAKIYIAGIAADYIIQADCDDDFFDYAFDQSTVYWEGLGADLPGDLKRYCDYMHNPAKAEIIAAIKDMALHLQSSRWLSILQEQVRPKIARMAYSRLDIGKVNYFKLTW